MVFFFIKFLVKIEIVTIVEIEKGNESGLFPPGSGMEDVYKTLLLRWVEIYEIECLVDKLGVTRYDVRDGSWKDLHRLSSRNTIVNTAC